MAEQRLPTFRFWLRPVVLAVVLVLLATAGAFSVGVRSLLQPHASRLFVAPSYLDVGAVWEHDAFLWTLPVENNGKRLIRVASIWHYLQLCFS